MFEFEFEFERERERERERESESEREREREQLHCEKNVFLCKSGIFILLFINVNILK